MTRRELFRRAAAATAGGLLCAAGASAKPRGPQGPNWWMQDEPDTLPRSLAQIGHRMICTLHNRYGTKLHISMSRDKTYFLTYQRQDGILSTMWNWPPEAVQALRALSDEDLNP